MIHKVACKTFQTTTIKMRPKLKKSRLSALAKQSNGCRTNRINVRSNVYVLIFTTMCLFLMTSISRSSITSQLTSSESLRTITIRQKLANESRWLMAEVNDDLAATSTSGRSTVQIPDRKSAHPTATGASNITSSARHVPSLQSDNVQAIVSQQTSQVQQHHRQHQLQESQESNNKLPLPVDIFQWPTKLHLGAQITLSALLFTVGLVVSATLFDLSTPIGFDNTSNTKESQTDHVTNYQAIETTSSVSNCHQQQLDSNFQQQLRDQRSPSLSSTNSSNLFYASSSALSMVSSSTAPILSSNHHHHQQQQQQPQSVDSSSTAYNLHYDSSNHSIGQQFPECQPDKQATICCASCHARPIVGAPQIGAPTKEDSSICEPPAQGNTKRANKSYDLAKQLFLSFSLRHSVSQIFNTDQQLNSNVERQQEDNKSLRHLNQLSSSNNSTSPESVDSLHGLRFLSMIWIIVIHSYSFAQSWLPFSNPASLSTIYKTAVSQWLANGSFACDTFFFASGFLLPHLAFCSLRGATHKSDQKSLRPNESGTVMSAQAVDLHSGTCSSFRCSCEASNRTSIRKVATNCLNYGANLQSLVTAHEAVDLRGHAREASTMLPSLGANGIDELHTNNQHHQLSSNLNRNTPPLELSLTNHNSTLTTSMSQKQQHNNQAKKVNTVSVVWEHHVQQHQAHSGASIMNDLHQNGVRTIQIEKSGHNFGYKTILINVIHRYVRMMPLMMAIIALSSNLLRYLGEGKAWDESTMMFDKWCRKNWWINAMFLHNFIDRQNMCLSHSWYSAVDIQLFLIGQVILFVLFRSRRFGVLLCLILTFGAICLTITLTLLNHLPAVPLISSFSRQVMDMYFGQIYIKPYCRASPYLIGLLLGYLMQTTNLKNIRLTRLQASLGWTLAIGLQLAIILATKPAMNGEDLGELESALYSGLSRPLWACATGWMVFACMTKNAGLLGSLLSSRCFIPFSKLTYPAFLIHPIVMATFYGSRPQSSFQFSHYLMLYLILGNIVITYVSAFILSALFELPLLSCERAIKRAYGYSNKGRSFGNLVNVRQSIR